MPPGTKLKITSNVMARNGFLLLTPAVVKILGGHVDHMVEKWKASKVCYTLLYIWGGKTDNFLFEKVVIAERRGNVGDGPPAFKPFSEATDKRQYSAKHVEQHKNNVSASQPSKKHSDQPKHDDVKTLSKQMDKPTTHRHHLDKAFDKEMTSHRQTGDKPHQHHQGKPSQQHDRFHSRPFRGQSSKQRTHNPNPHYRQSKGHTYDKSQKQPLSDVLPVTFSSNEEHFPALSQPTSHPQPHFATADNKRYQSPHKLITAWDSQSSNTSTTGGSVPFSAKRNT